MTELPKISNHELLSQRIYNILKNQILEGKFKEGSKVTEAEIADQLGVSKTPVREALRNLINEGFITLFPNKGMTISITSTKDVIEVYQIRKVLCGLSVKLLAEKIKDEEIIEFNKIFKKMEFFADKEDVVEYSKLADRFHSLINHLSGNERLENFSNILHEQVCRYRIKSLKVKGRLKKSLNEHKKILKSLSEHEPEMAKKFCQEHINNALENILQNAVDNKQESVDNLI